MADSNEDRENVRKSREGDHEAFEALVRRYQQMIHAVTYRMTGSMSDAEDLSEETFIKAFGLISQFRGEASFSSWLYRIAVNACLNWRKREQRRGEIHRDWAVQSESADADPELAALVQEALLQLNPEQRAAVILTTYDGMNHAEAAKVLGCSETTVSWRIFMARKKLKKLLKPITGRARTTETRS